jgi:hypothetical protein
MQLGDFDSALTVRKGFEISIEHMFLLLYNSLQGTLLQEEILK